MIIFGFSNWIATWWSSIKEPMADAGINTVVGIVVVFVALIFISFVISLFKLISVFEKRAFDKKAVNNLPTQAIEQTVTQIAEQEQESMDDLELVAVITAAINAYEAAHGNTATGGLVVRSIKRIDKKRWQNA